MQSGEHITKLDELQDIDELYVEEVSMFVARLPGPDFESKNRGAFMKIRLFEEVREQ